MKMRQANLEDIKVIMDILAKTITEMNAENNFQWDESYPQELDFIRDIKEGDLYVSEKNGRLVAFVCINKVEPVEYSGLNWSSNKEFMVIHRMSVDPEYRRTGVGRELLNFAEALALQNNIDYLKTDTNSVNTKMKGLFDQCGYQFRGEINFLGKADPFYCYDKKLGQSLTPSSSKVPRVTSVTSS